jgi:hypothetical protein
MQIFPGLALSSLALLAWGCAVDADPEPGAVASATSSVMGTFDEGSNGLSFNRITMNGIEANRIAMNRIAMNRIAMNRLSPDRLAYNSLDGLETTPEGRELLVYVARCALRDSDVLVATAGDETYEFPGMLGLAVEWEHRALEPAEVHWVSACLLAHVNAFDVSVQISLRAPAGRIQTTPDEEFDFPVYEGTFFGDVFGENLLTYACVGNDAEIAAAHASDRPLRACADPGPQCDVVELGYCRDVCDLYVPGTGWTECWAEGVRYTETVSTFLLSTAESCRAICSGTDFFCYLECPSSSPPEPHDDLFTGPRLLDCKGHPDMCTSSCRGGACLIDASGTGMAFVTVLDGGHADVSCVDAGTCLTDCKGPGTHCQIDCTSAAECEMTRCDLGASCLVDCTDAGTCQFDQCQGQVQYCANDVVVCNRACPGA